MKASAKVFAGVSGAALAFRGFQRLVCYEIFARDAGLLRANMDRGGAARQERMLKDPHVQWFNAQEQQDVWRENLRGQRLHASMIPAEGSRVYCICAHGYRSNGSRDFREQAQFLNEMGWNILLVDHQACGESEGRYMSFGYYESLDLVGWCDYLNETYGSDIRIVLFGISMGAASTLMAVGSGRLPENCDFAISDCAYAGVEELFRYHLRQYHVPAQPLLYAVDWRNAHLAGYRLGEVKPIEAVRNASIPVIFFHGERDGVVPPQMGQALCDACKSESELHIIAGAGHTTSYPKDCETYEAAVRAFAQKHLQTANPDQ